ncbi:UNVERIFIED_CONTAM: hypothetical protein GTU68_015156 [Idotea baltica]|nr:hypothetical protein [Idotea baltica]
MSENLLIAQGDRSQRYESLLPQIEALIESESDSVANLANIAAALHQAFEFLWVGFYRVQGEELILGPFQGPIACTRINKGAGVCGKAWLDKTILVVPDVNAFPGHIACSSASKSEIVVPIYNSQGEVVFVLDIDSSKYEDFDQVDQRYLDKLAQIITNSLTS